MTLIPYRPAFPLDLEKNLCLCQIVVKLAFTFCFYTHTYAAHNTNKVDLFVYTPKTITHVFCGTQHGDSASLAWLHKQEPGVTPRFSVWGLPKPKPDHVNPEPRFWFGVQPNPWTGLMVQFSVQPKEVKNQTEPNFPITRWDTCVHFLGPSDEAFLCQSQGTKLKNLTVDSSTKSRELLHASPSYPILGSLASEPLPGRCVPKCILFTGQDQPIMWSNGTEVAPCLDSSIIWALLTWAFSIFWKHNCLARFFTGICVVFLINRGFCTGG